MTTEDAKKLLEQFQAETQLIQSVQSVIANSVALTLPDGRYITGKEALEAELVSQLDLLIKDEARIIAAIMQMPDMHFRTILLDHYINEKGWEQIAAQFEVARQTVCKKWLEPALEEFSQKMDFIDYSDAASAGYKFGQGIADKVSGFFGGGLDSIDAFNMGNAWDGIYGNTADTAANTAATAEALDVAEEDLAYLRDIAEREAINRFTTAEIKVEQHNENHISKDADLDGIMDAWANDFAEKLEVSEEGVHE